MTDEFSRFKERTGFEQRAPGYEFVIETEAVTLVKFYLPLNLPF
jgi:hypothetical protein